MNTTAASILMALLCGARISRFDLLRAIGTLATKLTKWAELEGKKLFRLVSYVYHSITDRMVGFVGDTPDAFHLGLYSDADFAGDRSDLKSTSGVFLAVLGPHNFFPVAALSKRQVAVSVSYTHLTLQTILRV